MYILENIKDGLGNRIYCIINILYEAILNEDQINLDQLNNKQTGKKGYKYRFSVVFFLKMFIIVPF